MKNEKSQRDTYSIAAMILGGVALLFFPPFVGGAGVICAIIAKTKNEKLWGIGLAASIVGGALGALLGVMIWG
jgi:hypothetical protein